MVSLQRSYCQLRAVDNKGTDGEQGFRQSHVPIHRWCKPRTLATIPLSYDIGAPTKSTQSVTRTAIRPAQASVHALNDNGDTGQSAPLVEAASRPIRRQSKYFYSFFSILTASFRFRPADVLRLQPKPVRASSSRGVDFGRGKLPSTSMENALAKIHSGKLQKYNQRG